MKPWAWFPDGTAIRCEPGMADKLEILQNLLLKSFSMATSMDPDNWRDDNPTRGHGAVVALLVQDIYGGVILRASLEKIFPGNEWMKSHYWNRLPFGLEIDFTADQFKNGARDLVPKGEIRTREYLLKNLHTNARYELLKVRFIGMLKFSIEYNLKLGKIFIPEEEWRIKI